MTPRTDWQEAIAPDEAERFDAYAQQLAALHRRHNARVGRTLHTKGHLGVRAQMTVLPDLPEHARVGIFATSGTYQAWVRFSNGSFTRQSDRRPDVRGFAIKVLGVPGRKLIPGMEDARTQDFLAIQTPRQSFRNADEFVFFILAAEKPLTLLPRAFARLGVGRTLGVVRDFARVGKPPPSLAGQRFWSAVPIRWGTHAAKYSIIPVSPGGTGSSPSSGDYLAAEMTDRLARGPIEYDFAVQFYVDPVKTPIEDASVEWREEDTPFVRVARILLPQQDLHSESGQRQSAYIETLSFDPWHAPVEFRPLGNFQRARNHAYRVSTIARSAAKEPDGLEAIVP